jgi:PAS domain S-box-containing protein
MSSAEDPYIKVLLIEEELDTVSFISLFLSEVKECKLFSTSYTEEALSLTPTIRPDVILFSHGADVKDNFPVFGELHRLAPSAYLIVSLPEAQNDLMGKYVKAGAVDCIVKDKSYVQNIVRGVKKALIRIAERESFEPPPLSRATQFVLDEDLPDIVLLLDPHGNVLHANQAVVKLLSYDPKDLVQKPFLQIVSEESHSSFESYLLKIYDEPKYRAMLPLKSKSGEIALFEFNCSLMEESVIYGVARRYGSSDYGTLGMESETVTEKDAMPSRLGPYRVVTLLGAGSMGRVYKGYDEHLERLVAIKVINRTLTDDQDYIESFHHEAKLLAKITHPNIALIYFFGNLEGIPFFCMEYLPGGSLESVLQQKVKLEPEVAVSYTLQVAVGLNEALKKGVIHLDIKPSNLMIAENNRIKIVDFGLARKSVDTNRASVVGTPFYIAPEQFRGVPPDFRCDVYSLGVTFFRMLYGRLPYLGKNMSEVLQKQTQENIPSPELLDPSVPRHLYDIVNRMTSNDPAKRYDTYRELIQELERARRAAVAQETVPESPQDHAGAVVMRGLIFDQPFAEVLGDVLQRSLSGKLTLSWMDLCKTVHFKNGKVIAALSNQEGERFADLLLELHQLDGKKARALESGSYDLLTSYFSLMGELSPGAREQMERETQRLAWQILSGLFPWMMGEYLFEEGEFSGQHGVEISSGELLVRGTKEWQDISMIRQKLLNGRSRILLHRDFETTLKMIPIQAADSFLLFRFDHSMPFDDLFHLSGIPEEEFYRLIYLFHCAGVIGITGLQQEKKVVRPSPPEVRSVSPAKTVEPVPREKAPEPKAKGSYEPPIAAPEPRPQTPGPKPATQAPGNAPGTTSAFRTQDETANYYIRLAGHSFRSQNYYATVEYCKKALEHKKDAGTYELMGDALATHPKFRFEAMEAYKMALELNPVAVHINRNIADLYFTNANYALAKSKYKEFLKMVSDDQHSIERLAEISKRYKG